MGKWRFMRRGVGPFDYADLGFTATEGDVVDAVSAPDSYWVATDAGSPETVDRTTTFSPDAAYYGSSTSPIASGNVAVVVPLTDTFLQTGSSTELVIHDGEDPADGLSVVRVIDAGVYSVSFSGKFTTPGAACVQGITLGGAVLSGVTPKSEGYSPTALELHDSFASKFAAGDELYPAMYKFSVGDLTVSYVELSIARLL